MNRIILLVFFSLSYNSKAQLDGAFIKYLSENNLKKEHISYLTASRLRNDTLDFYLSKFHYQYQNDSLFLFHINRSKQLLKEDTTLLIHYSKHFLQSKDGPVWFNSIIDTSFQLNDQMKELCLIYQLSQIPEVNNVIPQQLQLDYSLYLKSTKKKPLVAGLLSAILPGSGLLYLNKPRAFASNLAIVGGFAYQTYESSRIFGWKHPLTIINCAFFSGFYVVNIAGSYMEVKKNKLERKKQYLIHANSYYNITYPSSLY